MKSDDRIELALWAQGFEARLAQMSRKLESTSNAPADLRHAAVDADGGISFKDEYGNVIYKVARNPDTGVVAPEYVGGPDPATPSAPFVDFGGEVVKIQHSGLDVDEEEGPADYRRTIVFASQEPDFEAGPSTYAGRFHDIDGSMTHRLPGGTWFIAVQWETLSGKLSGLSGVVEVEVPPLVDEELIQEGLDAAQERLDEARAEFEEMNRQREQEIDNLNEVVLPGLEEALQEKADSSALGDLDATLRQAFGEADEAIQQVADDARAKAEAAGATAAEADEAAAQAVAEAEAAFARAEAAETAASSADASAQDAADALAQALAAGGDATAAQQAADAARAAADEARGHADIAGTAAAEADAKAAEAAADAAQAQADALAAAQSSTTSAEEAQAAKGRAEQAAAEAAAAYERAQEAEESASSASGAASAAESAADTAAANAADALSRAQAAEGDAGAAQRAADDAQRYADEAQRKADEANTNAANADAKAAQAAADAARAVADAAQAARDAEAAHEEAGEAWLHADAAMTRASSAESSAKTHADNLPKVLHGTSAPSGTAPNGSIWWQHSGSLRGAVTAQWNRVNGQWVSTPIDSEAIANLDVGKLTTGGAVIDDAVINKVWADGIYARSAELGSLIVASSNMFPNGDLALGADNWDSNLTLVEDAAQAPPGYDSHLQTREGQGSISYPIGDYTFAAQGGKEYLFEMWIKADKPGSVFFWDWRDENGTMVGASGGKTWAIDPASGHSPGTRVVSDFTVPTEWTRIQTAFRLTPDATRIHPRAMYFNHANGSERNASISFGGVRLVPRNGAEVLVDGSVGARALNAQEVFTDEATANIVWAEVVRAGLLTAEEALIGGVLIEEGAITLDKLYGLKEIMTALLQAKKIEAGDISANAFRGQTFSGGTFEGAVIRGSRIETESATNRGVKILGDGIHGYDSRGNETVRITGEIGDVLDPNAGNFLSGRFYTNGPGQPGIILNPDYGDTSSQGPGIWFSESGWVDSSQPAIWADKNWDLWVRPKTADGNDPTTWFHGHVVAARGGGIFVGNPGDSSYRGVFSSGWGWFNGLQSNGDADFMGRANFHHRMYSYGHLNSTGSINVRLTGGTSPDFRRVTSVRAHKVNIETVDKGLAQRILDLNPRDWIDRTELSVDHAEDCEPLVYDTDEGPKADEDAIRRWLDGKLPRRTPGLVAEEVVEAGLEGYATYDEDEDGNETLTGVAYDRLWTLLIPLVREHRDKLAEQEEVNAELREENDQLRTKVGDMEARLAKLEALLHE